jgi:hypothetical protein
MRGVTRAAPLFPLFRADVVLASGFGGVRTCVLCGAARECLRLDEVVTPCPRCTQRTRVRRGRHTDSCHHCGTAIDLRDELSPRAACAVTSGAELDAHGCLDCLSSGRWVQSHDTEAGPVRFGEAPAVLLDLLRTPAYTAGSGECWPLCHGRPAAYLGPATGAGSALVVQGARVHVFGCDACGALRELTDGG